MVITRLNFLKRMLLYFIMGAFFGLLFTIMFSGITGFGYMINFWLDSLITGASFGILCGFAMELMIIVIMKKAKKIKAEVAQTETIVFDEATSYIAEMPKVFEGWLFLTEDKLIFKAMGNKKKQDIIIPISSIQKIEKFRLVYNVYINNVLCFQVSEKMFNFLNSKMAPLPTTQNKQN